MGAFVEFCGEIFRVNDESGLTVGREGDLAIDDNAYLHRHFLHIYATQGMWWLANVGSQLTATVSGGDGALQAFLAPGAQLPIVLPEMTIRFSAGDTTYELGLYVDDPVYDAPRTLHREGGATTASVPSLNYDQRLLLLALAEPALRAGHRAVSTVPSSQHAANRLGWSLTRFNRKLDYLCQKLARSGVRGVYGSSASLASNRRFRLVEYALAVGLIGPSDLALLEQQTTG